jgi:RNA polymerase sigma-70 factor (ECF subfamily)
VIDSESTEAALWERARRDEGGAFGLLFDLHHDRVYRRALGLMANTHDAEDVAAAAFFELWRKRRVVQLVRESVLPWLLVTKAPNIHCTDAAPSHSSATSRRPS